MISLMQRCRVRSGPALPADATHHNAPKGHDRRMVSLRETLVEKTPEA